MSTGLKEPIVAEAHKCFHLYGFRKTSVDQIASCMGISKKSIYKYFASKDELIKAVIEQVMEPFVLEVDSIIEEMMPASEAFQSLFKATQKLSSGVSRPMLDDVRMMPEAWEFIEKKRRKVIEKFRIILVRGKTDGMIRQDLNIDLCIRMFIGVFDTFANPNTLLEFGMTPGDFAGQVFDIFMKGILVSEQEELNFQ